MKEAVKNRALIIIYPRIAYLNKNLRKNYYFS